ncbi:Protein of unknown function [Tistlia consotensis]|uniref:Molybdopterin-guanine dinucleotide biosynthesis protein A n=1 Tax=Tistlia consotensis USBA 355 TaxID=560819 RepID=A0A1Y6BW15_9PROT|nr:DUF3305 domain-containing protein [Tistlia consotensis]SMF23828.1 Protein of unknown function [Tistlia consotensis USBA 355]SNR61212.1 Protein of unknown function [Tistlia consotensis]
MADRPLDGTGERDDGGGQAMRPTAIVERVEVGIVLERRESRHPWLDFAWKPVAAIAGAPARDPRGDWPVAAQGDDWIHFHAGTLTLEMFRKETEGYRVNLSQDPPRLFVVLRDPEDPEVDHPIVPILVTACPYEAQDYLDSGSDLVEPVAMPPELVAFLRDFVERNHVEQPFKKRQRRPYDPRKVGFAGSGGPAPVERPRGRPAGDDAPGDEE